MSYEWLWGAWSMEGRKMATRKLLNLDALIPRQDLDTYEQGATRLSGNRDIPVSELAVGKLHYSLLRKPDFQRETNDWGIDNVVTLIKSYRDADLIPAIILWPSDAGYIFIIDGAHRLSALIAWVNDDYGDGPISRKFFDNKIPKQQERYAQECRERVALEVGRYSDLSKALSDDNLSPERIKWAANISRSVTTQTVTGDAETAQHSFITINQRSVQIDETERYMIEARHKPHVIAARALVRSATGHQYWWKFDLENKSRIETQARRIYDILFEPENAELSSTIEMPVAGKPYSADSLRLSLEFINFANGIKSQKALDATENDADGSKTVRFLDRAYGVVKHISGSNPASLGLHPAVYFWGATGRHHPSAFLAIVSFIQYLIENNMMVSFCYHRARFEEFLLKKHSVIKHILSKFGGWKKSAPSVFEMYKIVFNGVKDNLSDDQIEKLLVEDHRFTGLAEVVQLEGFPGKKATRETKIAARRREFLNSALRCSICHARLPSNVLSDDHITRVADGGRGVAENIQLTHPYCNHGFKEYLTSSGKPFPKNPFGHG